MKKILMALALVSVLPLFAFGQTKVKQSAEKEVLSIIDNLIEAGLKRDVNVIDRLYSDDFFHTNPNGSIMTKEQVIALYKSAPTATIESSRHDEDKVRIYGKMAIVNNRATIKGMADNQPFERLYRVTYFLRKKGKTWQIVASHSSLILQ